MPVQIVNDNIGKPGQCGFSLITTVSLVFQFWDINLERSHYQASMCFIDVSVAGSSHYLSLSSRWYRTAIHVQVGKLAMSDCPGHH